MIHKEIQYLQKLVDYPVGRDSLGEISSFHHNEPISMDEILQLEATYNNGMPFPLALRELLYLAGEDCYCLEYNAVPFEEDDNRSVQTYMQETIRQYEVPNTALNSTTRPYYIIDCVYARNFRFVYLDAGEDPMTYDIDERDGSIIPKNSTLSQLIDHVIRHTHKLF